MNPSQQIDQLIAKLTDWRGKTLASVRKSILGADADWQLRIEPLQQPALVAVAQGQLHLAASELDVDVDTRWRFRQRRDRRRSWLAGRCRLAVPLRFDALSNPLGQASRDAVTVDARVAPHTSASKPCLRVSPHTAPQ